MLYQTARDVTVHCLETKVLVAGSSRGAGGDMR